MISRQQVDFYHEHGYVMVENVLSPQQVSALRNDLEVLIEKAAEVTENNAIYDLEDSHTPRDPRVRRIKTPHLYMPSARDITRDPKLIDILTQLIGPDVRLQTTKLNMKAPGYGAAVEWHQDWAFYPHTNDDLLAVGILLDDMEEINGPLQVVPGSHKGPVQDHHSGGYFCGAIDPGRCDVDFSKAVSLTGAAGSMSFHHVRTIHGSALNHSERSRRLLLFQYTAVDAWPLVQPVTSLGEYDEMIVAGEATLEPRLTQVPVRMPLPPAPAQGSIYENQRILKNRYFETYQADQKAGV